jgi:hypothetical protein
MKDGRRDGSQRGTPELFLLQTSITSLGRLATSFTALSRNCYISGQQAGWPFSFIAQGLNGASEGY